MCQNSITNNLYISQHVEVHQNSITNNLYISQHVEICQNSITNNPNHKQCTSPYQNQKLPPKKEFIKITIKNGKLNLFCWKADFPIARASPPPPPPPQHLHWPLLLMSCFWSTEQLTVFTCISLSSTWVRLVLAWTDRVSRL